MENKWISIKTELPSLALYVWVTAGGGSALIAKRVCGEIYGSWHWRFVTYDGREHPPFVPTHWQDLPLPAPLPNAAIRHGEDGPPHSRET